MTEFIFEMTATTLFVWLAFWRRDIVCYLLAVPVSFMMGFAWYERYPTNIGMVIAGTIIAVGIYSFYKVIENLIERIR